MKRVIVIDGRLEDVGIMTPNQQDLAYAKDWFLPKYAYMYCDEFPEVSSLNYLCVDSNGRGVTFGWATLFFTVSEVRDATIIFLK